MYVFCVSDETDNRNLEDLETLVWTPSHHLTDRQIDQFLVISRSVGTFARALDCSSSVKQPSLHMSAAAASRDITLVSSCPGLGYNTGFLSFTLLMYVHFVMILLFREDCCLLKRTPLTLALVAQGQSVYWILTSCLF